MGKSMDINSGSAQVIFSQRALAGIVAETLEQHPNETGGILLGHHSDGLWHVIEAIDPGPAARFTPVTFEYDTAYVNHLARKTAARYQRPLRLIGLWHRHPGSFDSFSAEDDATNRRYASQSIDGAISCLVNLDPSFRITAYHVPEDLTYRRLSHQCNDQLIPAELFELKTSSCLQPDVLEDQRQQRCLLRLLAVDSAVLLQSGPLTPSVVMAMEELLNLLEGQRHFSYAIRPCGAEVVLALVERRGKRELSFVLYSGASGEALIRTQGSLGSFPFQSDRLLHILKESSVG